MSVLDAVACGCDDTAGIARPSVSGDHAALLQGNCAFFFAPCAHSGALSVFDAHRSWVSSTVERFMRFCSIRAQRVRRTRRRVAEHTRCWRDGWYVALVQQQPPVVTRHALDPTPPSRAGMARTSRCTSTRHGLVHCSGGAHLWLLSRHAWWRSGCTVCPWRRTVHSRATPPPCCWMVFDRGSATAPCVKLTAYAIDVSAGVVRCLCHAAS